MPRALKYTETYRPDSILTQHILSQQKTLTIQIPRNLIEENMTIPETVQDIVLDFKDLEIAAFATVRLNIAVQYVTARITALRNATAKKLTRINLMRKSPHANGMPKIVFSFLIS